MSQRRALARLLVMLTWLIEKRITSFERTFSYDMAYARELLAVDRRAFMTFTRLMAMARYRKDLPSDAYFAAKLIGTIAEDCGPCTQLGVALGLAERIPASTITAILRDDRAAMPEGVRLVAELAHAVIAHAPEADALRDQVVARWGKRALVSIAFAITASRMFPTLKYTLGFGKACERIVVDGTPVVVRGAA